MSTIKFYNNSSWVDKPLKYWNGSSWVQKPLKYWNGSSWVTTEQSSLVPDYKIFLDAGNTLSYPTTGSTITNLGSATSNGTLYNVTYNTSGGGSLSFNGTSSYIDCGTDSSIANFTGLTASVWINIPSITNAGNILYKSDNNSSAGWWVDLRPTYSEVGIQIVNSSSNSRKYINRSNIDINTWVNLVCVWSGGTSNTATTVYLNNTIFSYVTNTSGSGTHGSDSAQPLNIGKNRTGSAAWFNGLISNVLIYDRALTATEVTQNYNAQKTRFGL